MEVAYRNQQISEPKDQGAMPQAAPPPPPPPPLPPAMPARPTGGKGRMHPSQENIPGIRLPHQQYTPHPKSQMKRLQWVKIPSVKIADSINVWTVAGRMFNGICMNFDEMEALFASNGNGYNGNGKDSFKARKESTLEGDKRKKTEEIDLIDSKRSMNVNIFLRRFRISNSEIVGCIRCGDSASIGTEKLRGLVKILPEPEDVKILAGFDGDRSKLGNAEKFYLELMTLPDHKLLVQALLMKEEFNQTLDSIKPAIDAIILSARDVKESQALHEIIYMVLIVGNFMNDGAYSGDAAGFQLCSLLKLTEIRANDQRRNLMHYVAQEAEDKNPKLIQQLQELKYLQEASQYSLESLFADIKTLQDQVKTISEQISKAGSDFQLQMKEFLNMARKEMALLDRDVQELEELRLELAAYFCEDEATFKLDNCISIFSTFCSRFLKALEENKARKMENERAEQKRREREEKSRKNSVAYQEERRSPNQLLKSEKCNRQSEVPDFPQVVLPRRPMSATGANTLPRASARSCSISCDDMNIDGLSGGPSSQLLQQPTAHRHRRNTSFSGNFHNFQPDVGNGDQNELIEVLLKSAAPTGCDDVDGKRHGSPRLQRRRSRVGTDFLDRERAPSPFVPFANDQPTITYTHLDFNPASASPDSDAMNSDGSLINRGNPSRNSCPTRLPSDQRGNSIKESLRQKLLKQHVAGGTANNNNGTLDEGSSGSSDAETGAKERENRRMERHRRNSRIATSVVTSGLGRNGTSDCATSESDQIKLPDSRDWINSRGTSGAIHLPPIATPVPKPTTDNHPVVVPEMISANPNARGPVRRDAAGIHSLSDQNRSSFDDKSAPEVESITDRMRDNRPEESGQRSSNDNKIKNNIIDGDSERQANPGVLELNQSRRSRLNSLSNTIPEQRIATSSKTSSSKNLNGIDGSAKAVNHTRSKSDHPLIQHSNEIRDSKREAKSSLAKWTSNDACNNENSAAQVMRREDTSEERDADLEMQNEYPGEGTPKRWGRIFDYDRCGTNDSNLPHQELLPDQLEDGNRRGSKSRCSEELADTIEDVVGRLRDPVRAMKRKENLKKISQRYSDEVDQTEFTHKNTTRMEGTDVKKIDSKDEGFDSEDTSTAPSSQRTSMSSSIEGDIRITPLMERKSFGESTDGDSNTNNNCTGSSLFVRSIDSLVSKNELAVVEVKESIDDNKKPEASRPLPTKPHSTKPGISKLAPTAQHKQLPVRPDTKQIQKPPTKTLPYLSPMHKPITLSTRPASKPASRVTPVAHSKQNPTAGSTTTHNKITPSSTSARIAPHPASDSKIRSDVAKSMGSATATSNVVRKLLQPHSTNSKFTNPTHELPANRRKSNDTPTLSSKLENLAAAKNSSGLNRKSLQSNIPSAATPPTTSVLPSATKRSARPHSAQLSSSNASPLVRGAGGRATLPAEVFRENKRAAEMSRKERNSTVASGSPEHPDQPLEPVDGNSRKSSLCNSDLTVNSHSVRRPVKPSCLPAVEAPHTVSTARRSPTETKKSGIPSGEGTMERRRTKPSISGTTSGQHSSTSGSKLNVTVIKVASALKCS